MDGQTSWAGLRPRLARLTEEAAETLVLLAHPATRHHQEDVTVTMININRSVVLSAPLGGLLLGPGLNGSRIR